MTLQLHLLLAAVFTAAGLFAHPPVSVVIDSRGNVYYSDLEQVWRVDPSGRETVVVKKVHTHELALDADDNLFGEHLWYESHTGKWRHYVWRRTPEGRITKVVWPREGFLRNYSFVRDAAGNMYWAQGDPGGTIRKRETSGLVRMIARGVRNARWLHATPDGTLYAVDGVDVVRIANGKVTRIARNIAKTRLSRPQVSMRHALMGIWTDRAENVYVADHANGEVKRVTPDGRITVAARSRWPWSPTGGTFAANGDLWLLETSMTNQVRVRRLSVDAE